MIKGLQICPYCKAENIHLIESKFNQKGHCKLHFYSCGNCTKKWTTAEFFTGNLIRAVKNLNEVGNKASGLVKRWTSL